ncbi:MAG: AEC family transporter [Pseudomonadota bacterium]
MPIASKFILFQLAVFLPFLTGYLIKGWVKEPQPFTKKLLRLNIIGLEPLINFWCIWRLDLSLDLIFLPLAGLSLIVLSLLIGMLFLPFLRLSGKRKLTFLLSSSLANHGFTMGGYLCYFFLGEKGLGLSLILILYFIPYIYCFVFPYAKIVSENRIKEQGFLKKFVFDPQNMPLFAMIGAFILQLRGIKSPDVYFPLDPLLLTSIALYYLTLGINFSGVDLKGLKKEQLSLSAIKFIVVPLITYYILSFINLDTSIKSVIMIQAFMPTAVYSVVTALLFGLEVPLASGLFVGNTLLFLTIVVPGMLLLRGLLGI